jgi:transposase
MKQEDGRMIVLGADMHKQTHTVAAIAAATSEVRGEKTVQVGDDGFLALLVCARLGEDRVWALEDCRHVSGSLERFLMASGERVVRVATRLMNDARRAGRERGKSDRIDALAVARAASREGIEALPSAQLAGVELEIRLLVDHRERLIRSRVALNNDLLWHLPTSGPSSSCPAARCFSTKWSTRLARRLARAEQTARVRIARDELKRLLEQPPVHASKRRVRCIAATHTACTNASAMAEPRPTSSSGCSCRAGSAVQEMAD